MLQTTHLDWLAQLPYCIEHDGMLLCHGSPHQPEEFRYILAEEDVEMMVRLGAVHQPMIFVGHSHRGTAFIFRLQPALHIWEDSRSTVQLLPDRHYVFNVGSVGQPRDGDWRASYGIVDTAARTFELRRTEYDVDTASEKIARLGFPAILSERLFLGV
jgi:diadenosine tetraphosphatase ApaH/serine/threonine PP2A family protein phosphatase